MTDKERWILKKNVFGKGREGRHMDVIEGRRTDDVISQSGYQAPGKAATTHKTCLPF